MKKSLMLAALAVLMVVGAGSAWAVGDIVQLADGTYRNIRTWQYTDADGNVLGVDAARDRDLDFGVTNLVASVAIDSGGTGGANFRYSAAVDVRKYTGGNIIVHITAADAADTLGHYVYGVSVFPLTSATLDWATTGVPIVTSATPATTDTLGFKGGLNGITANAIQTFPGERAVILSTDRTTSNYANINAGQTVSYPWQVWLGQLARPRYIAVQVRLMSRDAAKVPSVRIDLEGLR